MNEWFSSENMLILRFLFEDSVVSWHNFGSYEKAVGSGCVENGFIHSILFIILVPSSLYFRNKQDWQRQKTLFAYSSCPHFMDADGVATFLRPTFVPLDVIIFCCLCWHFWSKVRVKTAGGIPTTKPHAHEFYGTFCAVPISVSNIISLVKWLTLREKLY